MLRLLIEEGWLWAVIANRWSIRVELERPQESHTGAGKWAW
jgi:hypothetical protein